MIQKLNITDPIIAHQVLSVQIPAYKIEAAIINFYDIPPLKDTAETLQQCEETFYGYYEDDELCGAISFKIEESTLDIYRLIVHPQHFRKGIANLLLHTIEGLSTTINTITVSTGSKNTPAINLYAKHGFSPIEEIQITDQLSITTFKKSLSRT